MRMRLMNRPGHRTAAVRMVLTAGMVTLGVLAAGCAPDHPAGSGTPVPVPSSSAVAPSTSSSSAAPSPTASDPSSPADSTATASPSQSSTPTPTPTPEPFDAYPAYATVALDLRQTASADAQASSELKRADKVLVIGDDLNGYTPVSHDGEKYWVTTGFLSTTKPEPLPTTVKAPVATMWTTTELNVRTTPLLGGGVLGVLASGEQVTTAGSVAGNFTLVNYRGQTGWVVSKYLTATKPKPKTASTAGVTLDNRCTTGLVICISKADRQLRLVQDGKIVLSLDARFGSEAGPTREGTFKIEWRDKDWVSKMYGSKMPYAMFFSGGEAIHYSSDFAARGYAGNSHGCVNIRSMSGLQYLWDHAPVGTTVVVYR